MRTALSLPCLPYRLEEPLNRTRPTVYFVNSMSDLFHEEIPDDLYSASLRRDQTGSAAYLSGAH